MDVSTLPDVLTLIVFLMPAGILAGFLAGLLGIGGGTVLVPVQFYLYQYLGFDHALIMHMSVGTALAVTIPTALSSVRAHHARGAVDFAMVRQLGIGVFAGVIIGVFIATYIETRALGIFFAVVSFLLVFVMFADLSRFAMRATPKIWQHPLVGGCMGVIAALMGIGGAIMSVPYMIWVNVPIHRAVGTASALGIIVAIPAVIGYVLIGHNIDTLPAYAFGYIYMPAFVMITLNTVLAAPFGAAAAHKLPVGILRNVFSCFILVVAIKMGLDLL